MNERIYRNCDGEIRTESGWAWIYRDVQTAIDKGDLELVVYDSKLKQYVSAPHPFAPILELLPVGYTLVIREEEPDYDPGLNEFFPGWQWYAEFSLPSKGAHDLFHRMLAQIRGPELLSAHYQEFPCQCGVLVSFVIGDPYCSHNDESCHYRSGR